MIRIHVLLLASLLSIWGLTSCENSDTDKVNSYNLEVNLSQNEITAINGIISIKVSIKEFDQLAYLVINKINDTNNISEKYIKSNLSPEYIFEYIIKKDDSGELSIAYHPEFKKWILLYFNSTRYDISFRTADHIIGEWSKPQKLVDGWQYSQLYGSYIHPISLKGNILYFIMSMWLPYNTYLMSAELKCNP